MRSQRVLFGKLENICVPHLRHPTFAVTNRSHPARFKSVVRQVVQLQILGIVWMEDAPSALCAEGNAGACRGLSAIILIGCRPMLRIATTQSVVPLDCWNLCDGNILDLMVVDASGCHHSINYRATRLDRHLCNISLLSSAAF